MAKKDIFEIPDEKVLNLFFEQQRKRRLLFCKIVLLSLMMMPKTSIRRLALHSIRIFKVVN